MWNWKLVIPIPIYFHLTGTMITNHQIWGSIWSYVYVQIDPFSYILTFLLSWYIAQPQYAPYIYTYGIYIILHLPKAWPTWFKCMYIITACRKHNHRCLSHFLYVHGISNCKVWLPKGECYWLMHSGVTSRMKLNYWLLVLNPSRNILISCNHHLV